MVAPAVRRPLVWGAFRSSEEGSTGTGHMRMAATVHGEAASQWRRQRECIRCGRPRKRRGGGCANVSREREGGSDGPGRGSGRAGTEPGHLVQDRPRQALLCCLTQSLGGPRARRTAPPLLPARPPPRRLQHSTPGHAPASPHTGVAVHGVNIPALGVCCAAAPPVLLW